MNTSQCPTSETFCAETNCENECVIEIIKLPLISGRVSEGNLGECSPVERDFHTFALTRAQPDRLFGVESFHIVRGSG